MKVMPGYCREQTAGWCRKKLGVWLCVGVKIIPCEGYSWVLLETSFKCYMGGVRGVVLCRGGAL